MPRVTQSQISVIQKFFRSVSLEVMDLAFELIQEVVRERRGKSAEAKRRVKPAPVDTAMAMVVVPKAKRKARGPKKSHHKKRKVTLSGSAPSLPVDEMEDTEYTPTSDPGLPQHATLTAP